jgi:DNA modification methylase
MAIKTQNITDRFAIYNGDSCEVLPTLPDGSVDMSVYSPPFCGLYNYSSDPRDMSNCSSYDEFFEHYRYLIKEIHRLTKPGRFTAVHCMDVPSSGSSATIGGYQDFPGDIIRLHQSEGWEFWTRRAVWKEPLAVRLRTMSKGLAHRQICEDASLTTVAGADYILEFRKKGENKIPVTYDRGMTKYCGEKQMPAELHKYRNWKGKQTENRYSHWIWRNYASSIWDDIRIDNVLPYKECRDPDDEKHVHPLQLDVIERLIQLRTNDDEVVMTPFMGVGSECYGALVNNRKAVGVELKSSYYKQAVKNCEEAVEGIQVQQELF